MKKGDLSMPNELHIPVGTHVRFPTGFENYPIMVMPFTTGVVDSYGDMGANGRWINVKLDLYDDALDEWDNCIWVFERDDDDKMHPAYHYLEVIP